jgi:hypothetical protein
MGKVSIDEVEYMSTAIILDSSYDYDDDDDDAGRKTYSTSKIGLYLKPSSYTCMTYL